MELKNENMNERGMIYGKWMTSPNTWTDWEGLGFRQVYLAQSAKRARDSGCAAAGPRLWPGTNAPAAPDRRWA